MSALRISAAKLSNFEDSKPFQKDGRRCASRRPLTSKRCHNTVIHLCRGVNVNYEKILIYGFRAKIKTLTSGAKSIKSSCILAGDSEYYKLIISDTNIEKSFNDDFSINWTLHTDPNHD